MLTQRYAQVIEQAIRRCPTQWMILEPFFDRGRMDAESLEAGIAPVAVARASRLPSRVAGS